MKKLKTEIKEGFIWVDPEKCHVIACGDATDQDFLISLESEKLQLILADPPYQIASDNKITLKGRKDIQMSEEWDKINDEEMQKLIDAIASLAANFGQNANVWIWTSDWWISNIKRALKSAGFKCWPTYVWAKSNPPHSIRKKCVSSACEFLVMASGPGNYFNLDALPKQRSWFVATPEGEFVPAVCPWWVERPIVHHMEKIKKEQKNSKGKNEPVNKAQKPIDVTMNLILAGSDEDGLILDLFGGTGTTLVAADRANRRCIYIEKDPAQVRVAVKRLLTDRKLRNA
jgi:DNA modification methylase